MHLISFSLLVLVLILISVVNSNEPGGYYVVQMPIEHKILKHSKPFNVYWNVPTMQCKSKRIPFTNLFEDFGIIQNKNDSFRGEKISILYDPGVFPALLKNESSGKFMFRNGGVPQEGDLTRHLDEFRKVLNESVPDDNFDGVGIIDFESWRPIYRQNFGILSPYKDISYEIEQSRHRFWTKNMLIAEATRRFEKSAIDYMDLTLKVAKDMRPLAKWGYYAYPYCFNMAGKHMDEKCANNVPEENNRISWLWSASTALYPSLYTSKDLTTDQLAKMMGGRIKEAARVSNNQSPILPYFWFKYREGGFLSEKHIKVSLETFYKSNASGLIIWGSSNDVNTKAKCLELYDYVNTVLGPIIAKYTKKNTRLAEVNEEDIFDDNNDENNYNHTNNETDPEFHWIPPENYTQDIINYVQNEFQNKTVINNVNYTNTANTTSDDSRKENNLIDLLVNFLFKNKNKPDEIVEVNKNDKEVLSTLDPLETDVNNYSVGESTTNYNIKDYYETTSHSIDTYTTTNDNFSYIYDDLTSTELPLTDNDSQNTTEYIDPDKSIETTTTYNENSSTETYFLTIEDNKNNEITDTTLGELRIDSATENYLTTSFNYIESDNDITTNTGINSNTDIISNQDKEEQNPKTYNGDETIVNPTILYSPIIYNVINMNNNDLAKLHTKNTKKGLSKKIDKEQFHKMAESNFDLSQSDFSIQTKEETQHFGKNFKKGLPRHKENTKYIKTLNKPTKTFDVSKDTVPLTSGKNNKKGIPRQNQENGFITKNIEQDPLTQPQTDVKLNKNLKKGLPRDAQILEINNKEFISMEPSTSDQVMGSSATVSYKHKNYKFFFCIIYVFSVSKCICDVFGHCV